MVEIPVRNVLIFKSVKYCFKKNYLVESLEDATYAKLSNILDFSISQFAYLSLQRKVIASIITIA